MNMNLELSPVVSDEQLWRRSCEGDREAFTRIVERYHWFSDFANVMLHQAHWWILFGVVIGLSLRVWRNRRQLSLFGSTGCLSMKL